MTKVLSCVILMLFFLCNNLNAKKAVQNNLQDSLGTKLSSVVVSVDSIKNTKNQDSTKAEVYYGKASFYSKSLEGTKTSNDEIFRHNKLTAASNKFKLGTWLRVTNISNGKSIIVRVNDRMHPKMAKKGRIVDLSREGAKKLDFINKGITRVKVEIVPKETKQ